MSQDRQVLGMKYNPYESNVKHCLKTCSGGTKVEHWPGID